MQFRKLSATPWLRDALVKALGAGEVRSGVVRCLAEERALILQFVRKAKTGKVVVVQYPVESIAAAYDRLQGEGMGQSEFVGYFIVASAQALQQAEVDGTPYVRTIRPAGRTTATQAEILRVPEREADRG